MLVEYSDDVEERAVLLETKLGFRWRREGEQDEAVQVESDNPKALKEVEHNASVAGFGVDSSSLFARLRITPCGALVSNAQ